MIPPRSKSSFIWRERLRRFVVRTLPGEQGEFFLRYIDYRFFRRAPFRVRRSHGVYTVAFRGGPTFRTRYPFFWDIQYPVFGYLQPFAPGRGDLVVDAGAFVGHFALYAAALVGNEGRVLALEPDSSVFSRLAANVALNGCANIVAVNRGIWSATDLLSFEQKDYGYSTFVAGADDRAPQRGDSVRLAVDTLPQILEQAGFRDRRIALLKMDVEGAELEALEGCRELLRDRRIDHLAIATYHVVDGRQTADRVELFLRAFGYKAETGFERHLTTWGTRPGLEP